MPAAAEEEESIFGWNSNGGRNFCRRKLLVGERIEVRSVEEGFLGSWYRGTVIASKKRHRRCIRYDNILSDDGTDYLVETVDVSDVIEGLNPDCIDASDTFRGRLRPVPPKLDVDKSNLAYGLCVDVFFSEAWWEGVIFDHENGSEKRRVFFPDLGDELDADLQSLRITQSWHEGTETWECRGRWLFLDLIEKYKEDNYLPVSVKQLWYDIRDRIGFTRIQEWTCSTRHLWEDLILEVIDDNLRITINQFLHDYDAERYPQQELLKEASQAVTETNASPSGVLVIDQREQQFSCIEKDHKPEQSSSVLTSVSGITPEASYINSITVISSKNSSASHQKMILPKKPGYWQPFDCDAKSCPQAVSSYIRSASQQVAIHVRKHLKYMGWTIEHIVDEAGRHRFRYLSPDGKLTEHSLRQVCFRLKQCDESRTPPVMAKPLSQTSDESLTPPEMAMPHSLTSDESLTPVEMARPLFLTCENWTQNTHEMSRSIVLALPAYNRGKPLSRTPPVMAKPLSLTSDESLTPPEMAMPLSLTSDESLTPVEMARPLFLTSENWTQNTHEMSRSIVLALPAYNRGAALGEGRKLSAETLLECEPQRKEKVFKRDIHTFCPRNAVGGHRKTLRVRLEPKTEDQGFLRMKSKRKQKPSFKYNSMKDEVIVGLRNVNLGMRRRKTSRMLMDIKNRVIGRGKTRVSRSCKRVQRVITPISRNHSPLSILSWLIDNNVVLPRESIQCRNEKYDAVRKEGKITREGIKCNCCRRIFTISAFAVHADGGSCRAAANIFLNDGRSLLECQVEAYKTRKKAQPPDILKVKLRQGENDVICSICHYGGTLILCDGCPSAFHANCLGLEDVPDGDWFCASCCCGACGQLILKDTRRYAKEVLSCKQCELKYHLSCLHYDGAGDSSDTFLGEKWFCSKDCEEIFVNLCELIGKPREVGVEKNLSWRLVQSLETYTSGIDASEIEAIAENYCKLCVALDMMHELFKPVKGSHGGRDLAEDVIFSRWSKYKRLNFSGFYTVLLEKNDELVTMATVRIFGKKVAEMPFIGTRFQYRQSGMCRVLVNELEKVLFDLGVERLVLPAAPCALNTWTNSFGFTKMTISEKKDFLKFTFLEFGQTILCQKILIKSVEDPIPCTVSLGEPHCDILRIEDNSASDDRSEVQKAEQHLEESSSTKTPPEETRIHQEGLSKDNRIIKVYTRRRSKCMRLT